MASLPKRGSAMCRKRPLTTKASLDATSLAASFAAADDAECEAFVVRA